MFITKYSLFILIFKNIRIRRKKHFLDWVFAATVLIRKYFAQCDVILLNHYIFKMQEFLQGFAKIDVLNSHK